MKALHQMTNTDKAKLLADLFPDETENIIEAIQDKCNYLREHEMELRKTWDSGFMPFMFWLDLAADAEKAIKKYRHNMVRSSKVFSERLCFGHIALFTNDCIVKYAARQDKRPKFQKAVDLIFKP
jgi:hypothetical protein